MPVTAIAPGEAPGPTDPPFLRLPLTLPLPVSEPPWMSTSVLEASVPPSSRVEPAVALRAE